MDAVTVFEDLGEHFAGQIPSHLLTDARLHVFDALVSGLAGARTDEGRRTRQQPELHEGNSRGSFTLPAFGLMAPSAPALSAALARCIRSTEMDDIQLSSCTTPAAMALPAAVGAAFEAGGVSADRLLAGIVAGYEAAWLFGHAAGGTRLLSSGGWPSYVVAPVASAAAASRVLGLGAGETAEALRAATLVIPAARLTAAESRWTAFGCMVACGVQTAVAVHGEARGGVAALETRPVQEGQAFSFDLHDLAARVDTDTRWTGVREARLKLLCSAAQVAAALDALGQLREELSLRPGDVERIEVRVPTAYASMIDRRCVQDRISSLMSAQYQCAMLLAHPSALWDCARHRLWHDDAVARVLDRTFVVPEPSLDEFYPTSWPAAVHVTAAGRKAAVLSVDRSPDPCWTWQKVEAKASAIDLLKAPHTDLVRLADAVREFGHFDDLLASLRTWVSALDQTDET